MASFCDPVNSFGKTMSKEMIKSPYPGPFDPFGIPRPAIRFSSFDVVISGTGTAIVWPFSSVTSSVWHERLGQAELVRVDKVSPAPNEVRMGLRDDR